MDTRKILGTNWAQTKKIQNLSSVMASSQTEAKNVRASSYDNVLLAAQCEGHRGGFHSYVGREAPQGFARALIRGRETAVGLARATRPAARGTTRRPALGGCGR